MGSSNIFKFKFLHQNSLKMWLSDSSAPQWVALHKSTSAWFLICGLLLTTCFAGCSAKEGTGTISGKVTLNGKSITSGSVGLISNETGQGASGEINASGEFEFTVSLPAGTYVVTVAPPPPPGPTSGDTTTKTPDPVGFPKKYRSSETSDLKKEVKEGSNKFNIDLTE